VHFKPKILVVEDDQAMLHLLGEVLGQMGAEPRLVASSTLAAELIEREKFDGVFLDLLMPELDGLELARRIRRSKSNATVPLVVISASPEPTAMQDSFQAGINFFLHKPVTAQQLGKLLNAARGLMLEERRRYQRAPVALLMRCRWQSEGGAVAGIARQVTGHPLPAVEAPRRPGDAPRLVASPEKIRRELGWQPEHPGLETILASAWEWHRGHPRGYGA